MNATYTIQFSGMTETVQAVSHRQAWAMVRRQLGCDESNLVLEQTAADGHKLYQAVPKDGKGTYGRVAVTVAK